MSESSTRAPSIDGTIDPKSLNDVEKPPMEEKQPNDFAIQPAPETVNPWHPSQFPDGGKDAWLCLFGGAFCLFCSFGWLSCVGVFQNYYQFNQLRDHSSSQIAWIASLEIFMMFFPGPIVGFFYDNHGPKYLIVFGAFFHVFGLMMSSLCKEYYQFILAQGICSPLGLNCIFNAGMATIPTWFLKKRGMAYGIMAAGSGLGGVIFPIMASHLIPEIGFGWTMRTLAFMILGLLMISLLTVKSRLPPRPRALEFKVFLEPFRDIRFVMIVISSWLFFLGLFIPINYIEVQALAGGMSFRLAGYLLPILNSTSIFGRVLPGALADKVGPYNMQVVMSFFAAIIVLALGLPASSNAAFIAFAALYGFASGAYVSILPAQLTKITKIEHIGLRTGVTFFCLSFAGLVGNPIAGAIVDADNGKFHGLSIFAGVVMIAGAVMFTMTRMLYAQWKLFVLA